MNLIGCVPRMGLEINVGNNKVLVIKMNQKRNYKKMMVSGEEL